MDKKALIKALRDTVQSASNTVASGVSAPVDLIAAGLRKVGLPIPQAPVGGSQWMENMGLTIPVEDGIPKLAGETLGMIVPMAATAKAPQIAAAANRGLENLAAPRTLNTSGYGGQRGAIVWHGSPHKFAPEKLYRLPDGRLEYVGGLNKLQQAPQGSVLLQDFPLGRFRPDTIGTGEGAAAYGHGAAYLSEAPVVAKEYQKALSGTKFIEKATGKIVDTRDIPIDQMKNLSRDFEKYAGSLYKVDLPDEAIARMLDWDKPLSQQPHVMDLINKQESARTQSVLDQRLQTLANVGEDAPNAATLKRQIELLREEVANPQSGVGSMTGGKYYNYLLRRDMPPAEQADMFRGAGIPGIRYLDAGSRATGGTSNFVVFPGEERLLKILERNGQPMGLMGVK